MTDELPDLLRKKDVKKLRRQSALSGAVTGLMLGMLGTGYFMGKGMWNAFNYHEREKAAIIQKANTITSSLVAERNRLTEKAGLPVTMLPAWSRDLQPSIQLEDTLTGIVRTRAVPKHWNLKAEEVEMGAFRDRPEIKYTYGNESANIPELVYGVKTEHAPAKKIDLKLADEEPTDKKLPFFEKLRQRWLQERVNLSDLIDASASPITTAERVEGEEIHRTKVTLVKGKWTLHIEESINPRLGERALNYTLITGKPNQHEKAVGITHEVRVANDRALYMHKLGAVHDHLYVNGNRSAIDGVEFNRRK